MTAPVWEYAIFEWPLPAGDADARLAEQFNRLGQEGWELVQAYEQPYADGRGYVSRAYFKRLVPEQTP